MLVPVDFANDKRSFGGKHSPGVGAATVLLMDGRVGVRQGTLTADIHRRVFVGDSHHLVLRVQDLFPKRDPIQRVGFSKLSHRAHSYRTLTVPASKVFAPPAVVMRTVVKTDATAFEPATALNNAESD